MALKMEKNGKEIEFLLFPNGAYQIKGNDMIMPDFADKYIILREAGWKEVMK